MSDTMSDYAYFELHRMSDALVYQFDRTPLPDGQMAYKRRDRDLWIVFKADLGWVAYDEESESVNGRPWNVLPQAQGDHPPEGEWVSKKGSKSYVYDLTYSSPPGATTMTTASTEMPPQGHFAAVNGMQMYYEVYGEGAPLVLLHGFTGTSQVWEPFFEDFARHYRLIVPDLRGHGRSTNPSNQFTHRQSALDVLALLEQLEVDTFKAMGISTGGMTLLHIATQQPSRIEAMALIGATSYFGEESRAIQRDTTPEGEDRDWELLRERHVYGDDQIRALLTQFHNFADSYDDMNFTPPYLSTIKARTLIVHGDRDVHFPVSIPMEMYASIPNSYLWIIPNGGHVPIMDELAPMFTQTALAFLGDEWE